MKHDHYDLVVVGTGFASSFFLKKYLVKSKGKKRVLVLEKGHFYPYTERLKVEKGLRSDYQKYASPWQENIINLNPKKVWQFTTA